MNKTSTKQTGKIQQNATAKVEQPRETTNNNKGVGRVVQRAAASEWPTYNPYHCVFDMTCTTWKIS
jgi:hypothetical protein